MSVAMWNCHSWPLDVSSNVKLPFLTTRCQYWGSISQSRFVCQVWCSVLKASILDSLGGPSAKVGLSTTVWCSSIQGIYSWFTGGPSAKVCLSAKFCVLVFKGSILDSLGGWGCIGQSRFVYQVWCSGIQGINSWFTGGSIGQSKMMFLHTSFKLHLVITVKIKHTLHCLYIKLYKESVVFGVW